MCSSTCEMPCSGRLSLREPALTQMPRDALSRCGMSSVMTVMPLLRVVDCTLKLTPPRPGPRSYEGFYRVRVVGENVEALLPLVEVRQPCRKRRFNTRRGFDGSRKL